MNDISSGFNPDVLNCIANLSNDEVFTPPTLANQMLDLLPENIWMDRNAKFLDPFTKSGVFLREITKRLLKAQIPNYKEMLQSIDDKKRNGIGIDSNDELFLKILQETIDHILHNQVYGIGITELTSLLSRRSLYCSKYPNCIYSISRFENADGNIRFKKVKHTWKFGKCVFCGAPKAEFDRDDSLETHAYEFIHVNDPKEIFKNMKFDVIIGNPPYQIDDGGNGASASPIYQYFIEQAQKLNPRYLTMIIPARWYAGGKGLDDFRKKMLEDKKIVKLVDYVNAKDCFPGISIGGGVCYFLWDRNGSDFCEYTNIHDGKESTMLRKLDEYPVFVRYNEAISIINKANSSRERKVSEIVGSRNPYGLSSSVRGEGTKNSDTDLLLYSSGGTGYIRRSLVTSGFESVEKYKVIISKVTSEHAGEPNKDGTFSVVSTCKVLKPNEVCTDSYIVLYEDVDYKKANNFASFVCTKFFRFLLLQAVSSINLSRDKFQFIPMQEMSSAHNDTELYHKYNFTDEEIEFIEKLLREKTYEPVGGDSDE